LYTRILGPVHDKNKRRILATSNIEFYANVKNPTITETISLHGLWWFGHVERIE
jgi:hypothetical protein